MSLVDEFTRTKNIEVTMETYINEIKRVAVEADTYPYAVSFADYEKACKRGFAANRLYRKFKIKYSDAVREARMMQKPKKDSTMTPRRQGDIVCSGTIILLNECVPGNRPGCKTCDGSKNAPVVAVENISIEECRALLPSRGGQFGANIYGG